MSRRRAALAAGGTLVGVFATRRLFRAERVDYGILVEPKTREDRERDEGPQWMWDRIVTRIRQDEAYRSYLGLRPTTQEADMAKTKATTEGVAKSKARKAPKAEREGKVYPYQEGDALVLGPEVFTYADGTPGENKIFWRGVPFLREEVDEGEKDKAENVPLRYLAARQLIDGKMVLSARQLATLNTLDRFGTVALVDVHRGLARSSAIDGYAAVLLLQDMEREMPVFSLCPDGALRPREDAEKSNEDDGDDEEIEDID